MAQNPVPFVNQPLVPTAATPGGPGFTLTVNGTGFISGATVWWNGVPLPTTFVSSSKLNAAVPAANIATAGTASVTVVNPVTSVASNVVPFSVAAASSTVFFANATNSPIFVGPSPSPPYIMPFSVAVGDFNGDGKQDLVVGMQPGGTPSPSYLKVFLGNGDGTFTELSSSTPTGVGPLAYSVGDLNGDGKPDLAVVNYRDGTVTILLGNGDGTFAPAPGLAISVNSQPMALVAGDFNGDGKLDLAVTNSNSNNVSILLGNGDGTFTPASGSPISVFAPTYLAAGDFNGDGKLDLAVISAGSTNSNNLVILLGNGDGTFTLGVPQGLGLNWGALVAADFNGDGKLDLALASYGMDSLTVLLGNGDGTFRTVTQECCAPQELMFALNLAVGDFNADGKLDLVVPVENAHISPTADYLVILLGNGDGTFTATDFSLLVPDDPYSLAVGDFNGDGYLDFATANQPYQYLSVLLQTPPQNPPPDFAITSSSSSVSVQPGGTATYNLQLASLNGFVGTVSLSCLGAPSNATCSTVSIVGLFPSATASFALTVATSAPSSSSVAALVPPRPLLPPTSRVPLWAAAAGVGPLALIGIVRRSKRTRCVALSAIVLCMAALASCGSRNAVTPTPTPVGGTPAGTYTLTITATSGALTHSTTVTLIVQ